MEGSAVNDAVAKVASENVNTNSSASKKSSSKSKKKGLKDLPKLRGRQLRRHEQRTRSLSPSRGGVPIVQNIKIIPDDEVSFALEMNKDSVGTIIIENTSNKLTYAFRVKTNAPDRYLVRPAMGLVSPKSTIRLKFVLRANDVNTLLKQRFDSGANANNVEVEGGGRAQLNMSKDKFLILTAEVERGDLSTEEEVKDLSTLWSTSRWKKKTKKKKLRAEHHRMITVSSDSSDSEDEDDGQDTLTVGSSQPVDVESVPNRHTVDSASEDAGKLLESPPAIPRQKNIQQAITSSPLSIPRKPSLGIIRGRNSPRLKPINASSTKTPTKDKVLGATRATPPPSLLIDSPSSSPKRSKLPSPGGKPPPKALDPLFRTTVSERPSTAPSAQSDAKATLKAWAKSTESTIAKFDSLSLSEKLKKYKELQLKTAALNMPRKAWGIVDCSNEQENNGSMGAQKNAGKSSTASWIIEVKKEALLREQKRKLKTEQDAIENKRLEKESNSTGAKGTVMKEKQPPAKVMPAKKAERYLVVDVTNTFSEQEEKSQTSHQQATGAIIDISLDSLFVPEYPWKPPVLTVDSKVASASPLLMEYGCNEDAGFMNDANIYISSDLYINSYHHRLSSVWGFLYELRSHHIFWIDDVIGPVELDTTTIFNNQYGLVHSPSRSPERAGTPTQSPYKTYELNDNHNSDPLLLTSNAYLRYNDTGTNAAQILPDITRMDFIKSVVFLEKNIQQAQFALLQLEDYHYHYDPRDEESLYNIYELDLDSGENVFQSKSRPRKTLPSQGRPHVAMDLPTNAILFMWYVLAKKRIQLRKHGQYVRNHLPTLIPQPQLTKILSVVFILPLQVPPFEVMDPIVKKNSKTDKGASIEVEGDNAPICISDDDSSDDDDQSLSYNNTAAKHTNINDVTQGVDGWSAQHCVTFASIRALEKCIQPYWDAIERFLSLRTIINYSKEQNEIDEAAMRIKLEKTMSDSLIKSPWGDASAAAQRVVNTKRDEKKVEAKTKHKLALRALERTQKSGTKLRNLEVEFNIILKKACDLLYYPIWYLEWRCGSLQCDTEALEAYPSSYWWTYDYENKLPPGWWPCETYEGYVYYCHDDGRVQWEDPSAEYVVENLPFGWHEAETDYNGTMYKYYYYIDQDTGLVDNVQWEFPSTVTFDILDHNGELGPPKTPQASNKLNHAYHPNSSSTGLYESSNPNSAGGTGLSAPRTPRTPRTPSNHRASSGKGPMYNEIESPLGVRKMKFTFDNYDISKHASTSNPGGSGKAAAAASNPTERTPPKSNSPVNDFDYYNSDWSTYDYDYGEYTQEQYDMDYMTSEYAGYRAGYSHALYTWYHKMYKHPEYSEQRENQSMKGYSPLTIEPKALEILGEETPKDVASRSTYASDQDQGGDVGNAQGDLETAERNVLFTVRALADYEKSDETEMDLYDGELLSVYYKDESGWWEAKSERTGLIGWIPSNFVQVKHEMWTIYEEDLSGDLGEDGEQYEDNAF